MTYTNETIAKVLFSINAASPSGKEFNSGFKLICVATSDLFYKHLDSGTDKTTDITYNTMKKIEKTLRMYPEQVKYVVDYVMSITGEDNVEEITKIVNNF